MTLTVDVICPLYILPYLIVYMMEKEQSCPLNNLQFSSSGPPARRGG